MDKILSISVASYNVEKTLGRTVDSVIHAADCLEAIEVIIVNDGSTDGTAKIAKEYVEKYPDTVKMIDKQNGGYGSTINASLAVAKGKYYKLLDGDDTFVTENLTGFIRFLKNCNADIVITPYNEVYESSNDIKMIDAHLLNSVDNSLGNIVMHEVAAKTDMLCNIRTNITEHCFYTDNEFVFYALLGTNLIKKFSNPIYNYNLGVEGQSVSIEGIKKHYKDTITVSNKVCSLFDKYIIKNNLDDTKQKLLENKIRIVVRNVYGSFLVMDGTREMIEELKSYDSALKAMYPEAYRISSHEKKISFLRKTGFLSFNYLSKREKKRFG